MGISIKTQKYKLFLKIQLVTDIFVSDAGFVYLGRRIFLKLARMMHKGMAVRKH